MATDDARDIEFDEAGAVSGAIGHYDCRCPPVQPGDFLTEIAEW